MIEIAFLVDHPDAIPTLTQWFRHRPHASRRRLVAQRAPRRDRRVCLRDVWLYDGSPAKNTNVLGSDRSGMTSAATRYTAERGLRATIAFVGMTTRWTTARGVARIDQHNRKACTRRRIGDRG